MKKQFILLILAVTIVTPLSAQRSKDALYLKNGSIIYGKLLEISDNKYRIETSDKSLFIFSNDEVDKFVKEIPHFDGRKISGSGFALEAGLLTGAQNNDLEAPFSFNILFNYTVATKNILGIGTGVEFLNSTFAPLFLEYKRILYDRKITPFIFIRGGGLAHFGGDNDTDDNNYPYNYAKDYKGGASFGLGTGISWAKEESETYLTFAYRYAHTSYQQDDYNNVTYTYKNNFNRLEIKFGFKF
jgi:hypothetical protein